MVTLGWISPDDGTRSGQTQPRTVATPLEHQGVRNALRKAFAGEPAAFDLPDDMRRLLVKLG